MSLPNILICLALLGSLVLVTQHRPLAFPVVAFVVSAFETLTAFHLVQLSVARVPLSLVFGIALLIAGAGAHVRAAAKSTVSAATVVTLVGALQTFSALHLH